MTTTGIEEGDTGPAIITDHPFVSRGESWDLCFSCGLARAAHADGGQYVTGALPFRCASCIAEGEKVCTHGRP